MINLQIWASGSGSNAENICQHFKEHPRIAVHSIMTNNPNAGVIQRAARLGILLNLVEMDTINSGEYLQKLDEEDIDIIVLAGYLKLVPQAYVQKFEGRMINLHPALLPKYGGKGMYGHHVHEAVIGAAEQRSGITIHLVNEQFDEGEVLAQFSTPLENAETVESLEAKIHALEQRYFPSVIEDYGLSLYF